MSLSSHLENRRSPVRDFLYTSFPKYLPVVRKANAKLRGTDTIRPTVAAPELAKVRPADRIPYPYAEIGTAIDYRIRYYFSATGAERLVAHSGAYLLAHEYCRVSNHLMEEFFTRLKATLLRLAPEKRQLPSDHEMELNRYCFVLALLEQARRMPPERLDRSLLFLIGERVSVSELLAIPKEPWLEDMQSLSRLFYEKFEKQLAGTAFRLNPTFEGSADIGGADADLILYDCLLDIKTTIDPRIQNRNLYQLLGYVLLDFSNEYGLDEVGFYFSRQGTTVRWPLTDLLDHLCVDVPRPRLAELRARFRSLLLEDVSRRYPSGRSGLGSNPTPLIPPAWIADPDPATG